MILQLETNYTSHTRECTRRGPSETESRLTVRDNLSECHHPPILTNAKVTGKHAFKAPDFKAGDQRGPCPGLNALANHGYIPRNGVVSMAQAISAINQVYGMGVDLATILAVMGTVWAGNPLSLNPGFSIGGQTRKVQNLLGNLLGLLGEPQGLIASHNFIESDASTTRQDLYLTGDNYRLDMTLFKQWLAVPTDASGSYPMSSLFSLNKMRFDQSVATNPNFYYGPFTGMIARNAGTFFSGQLMRNFSTTSGVLDARTVKSFYAVYDKSNGALEYREGHEQIPANWYRRTTDWTLVDFNVELLALVAAYPVLGSIGGNMGTVNSFTGVNLGDLTGGLLNAQNLLKGNNLMCFILQVVKTVSPNSLATIFTTLAKPLSMLTDALRLPLINLACPAWGDLTLEGQSLAKALEKKFPGAEGGRVL
ncbi:Cloroperoxidase [Patellaria atrata CBS 101060]|uniref:Cloroperoxidase n=1 Tax=Patellaria atrata CBS 101060 TaxID=1346257 RepID=A0A9P4VQU1_9PEZI|nr:Cloroperoxidase [Patellaria atrata CBS 101060]